MWDPSQFRLGKLLEEKEKREARAVQEKSLFDPGTNTKHVFPPDATDEEIASVLNRQALPQSIGRIGQMLFDAATPVQHYPVVDGIAAAAMGPNYQSFRETQLKNIEQSKVQAQQERDRLRQELQAEKDRALRISLEQQKLRNDERERKAREEAEKRRLQFEERRLASEEERAKKPEIKISEESGQVYFVHPDGRVEAKTTPEMQQAAQEARAFKERMYNMMYGGAGGGGGGGDGGGGGGGKSAYYEKTQIGVDPEGRPIFAQLGRIFVENKDGSVEFIRTTPPAPQVRTIVDPNTGMQQVVVVDPYDASGRPVQLSGQQPVQQRSLAEIHEQAKSEDVNKARTIFVREAAKAGYTPQQIEQYVEQNKLYDDNSIWPLRVGQQKPVSQIYQEVTPQAQQQSQAPQQEKKPVEATPEDWARMTEAQKQAYIRAYGLPRFLR